MNKGNKSAFIWPVFSFYHVARARAFADAVGAEKMLCLELTGGSAGSYTQKIRCVNNRAGMTFETLFPNQEISGVSGRELGKALIRKLESADIQTIFLAGYGRPENRAVIRWAHKKKKRVILFFETKENDFRRFFFKEWVKRRIVKHVHGALCGGLPQKNYALKLGIPSNRIALSCDVVDNDFFSREAGAVREQAAEWRMKLDLPENYFFSCSRFVRQKNIFTLLDAYRNYRARGDRNNWGLIICGAGPLRQQLLREISAKDTAGVRLIDFQPPARLVPYYALARCFILASTYEPWGLVVNEAMACGLPVLVSRAAGAAAELVREGENGMTFDPHRPDHLASHMSEISSGALDLAGMGKQSEKIISGWGLDLFVKGAQNLIAVD